MEGSSGREADMTMPVPMRSKNNKKMGKKMTLAKSEAKKTAGHAKKSVAAGKKLIGAIKRKDTKAIETHGRRAAAQLVKSGEHMHKLSKPVGQIGKRTVRKAKKAVKKFKQLF